MFFLVIISVFVNLVKSSQDIDTCSMYLDASVESFIGTLHDIGDGMKRIGYTDFSADYMEALEGINHIENGKWARAANKFADIVKNDELGRNGFAITGLLLSLSGTYLLCALNTV